MTPSSLAASRPARDRRRRVGAADRAAGRRRLRIDDALTAVADLRDYPLRRHPARLLVEDIVAKRDTLTSDDAAYVCLAERLDATLVTADDRLVRATGVGCAVRLLEP